MGAYDDKMNLVLFESMKLDKPWTLQTYRSIGGYEVWEKILRERYIRGLRRAWNDLAAGQLAASAARPAVAGRSRLGSICRERSAGICRPSALASSHEHPAGASRSRRDPDAPTNMLPDRAEP